MGKILGVALAGWVLLSCQAGSAVTWYVDGSVPESGEGQSWDTALKTIQEGIDASAEGDTIIVARGTYWENILFKGKNVVLRSTDPLDPDTVASTIIDGDGAGSVVTFSGEEDDSCLLSGFTIQNGEFYSGGGIRGNSTRATISHNLITQNAARSSYASYTYGGGVSWCNGMIFRNTITRNTVTGKTSSGGGLHGCSGSIRENVISHNSATGSTEGNGGGLCSCSGTIQNNRITDNSAGTKGGGLYQSDGRIQNNLIVINSASEGAGLFDCDGEIQNNTIFGNAAGTSGGGLAYCHGAIRNCIIWGNTATTSGAQLNECSNPTYCCIQEWAGEGLNNISDDARFVDPEAVNYRLQEVSPCLDAGVDYYWFVWPQLDLDGNCRLAGEHVDMGCYEYESSRDTDGDLLCDSDEAALRTNSAFDDTDRDGLRDGLEILRGGNPREPTQPGMLNVPSELPTVQAGLCLGVNGDEIVVAPGTYHENLRFCGPTVILRSSAPTDADTVALTVIDGSASGPVIRLTGAETNACGISGFTIRNGRARAGGGICGGTSDAHGRATIENNVITANVALDGGGGISYCDGAVRNNTVTGNSATGEQSYGGGVYGCNGAIQNNIISENSATGTYSYGGGLSSCQGTLQNNLIVANSTNGYGGGLSSCNGLVMNNTIVANIAHTGGGLNYCRGMILNCIVWGNTATDSGAQISDYNGPIRCCIQDWSGEGIGNISDDPLFMIATGGDYHLLSESPCINAGVNYYWVAWPQHDMDGMCRLASDQVDMGCYEYGAFPDTDGDLLADAAESAAQTDVSDPDTDGDGLRDGVEMLAGTDPLVANSPRTIHVPADVPTIQQALSLARNGDEIVVAPGTYRENVAFCGAQVVLRSTNPQEPDVVASTVIDGGGVGPVVSFRGDESDSCVLSGFTLTGGSGGSGGGVAGHGTLATIRHNVIIGNSASNTGGGLSECHGTIEHNTISGNSARSRGGGLSDCHGAIQFNVISDNWAEWLGGGLSNCEGLILGNAISANTSDRGGGGIAFSDATIRNNVINENSAGDSGGGLDLCHGLIENNTIFANRAVGGYSERGGGLSSCRGTIRNCIIWRNYAADDHSDLYACSVPSYSCVYTLRPEGVGNISALPHFVDPSAGDLHLQGWSPCIDAGDPASLFTNEPEPNGGRVNMGAYGNTPEAASTSAGDADDDQLPDEWEMEYFGDLSQAAADDPDNDFKSNMEEYQIGLNPIIPIGEDAHWYVDASVPASGAGISWKKAFKTIQEGINVAYDGDIVAVKQGTYVENIAFRGKNIVLTSTDPLDPEIVANTIIDGTPAYHRYEPVVRFYGTEKETCILSGFTIRSGISEYGGGIWGREGGGRTLATIRHNVITQNSSSQGGAISYCDGLIENNAISKNSGPGLYNCGGTIRGNLISDNSSYGEGAGLWLCDGIIENNIICGNSSLKSHGGGLSSCDGTIQNNIIARNDAISGGGLACCEGLIQSNTIVANTAQFGGGLFSCNGTIKDCIVWGNAAINDTQVYSCVGPTYSCIQYWSGGGEGNLTSAPHFTAPENGDFHLKSWSPCIDAGDPSSPFANEPDPDGNRVNMGAYGNTPEAARKSADADADGLPDDWELHWFDSIEHDGDADPDADLIRNAREYFYNWNPSAAAETLVENLTKEVRYQCIQPALWEADDGDEIVVHAGTYLENINLAGRNVILRSADPLDPSVVSSTIIDGNGDGPVVTFQGTEDTTCVLAGFTIQNGKSPYAGGICGGISGHHTVATIERNVIIENFAVQRAHEYGEGGGINRCDGIIRHNLISRNSAYAGGGLSFSGGPIENNIISHNKADLVGGGLCNCNGPILNNTIYGNSAESSSGGLTNCTGPIRNCIIWKNAAQTTPQFSSRIEASYSCIQFWIEGGEGNTAADPRFIDPDNGNFHLQSWSPCIDAGDPTSPFLNEPDPNGGRVNMGAYGNTPEATSQSADTDADGLPDDWELHWFNDLQYDGDADPDGDLIINSREFQYDCPPNAPADTLVQNVSKEIWYQTIQPALEDADAGDEIVAYPGLYVENLFFGGKNLVVRSADPSNPAIVADTVIDGGLLCPVVTFEGTEDATSELAGLTIRNGRRGIVGGSSSDFATPVIESNIIVGNLGVGVLYCGGDIRNNTISDNSRSGLFACHGTIENNRISGNEGRSGGGLNFCNGTIRRNFISGNTAEEGGGLSSCDGVIEGNIISENSATGEESTWCRGGGLHRCDGVIRNNTISDNSSDDYGGGLYDCSGVVEKNLIIGNEARTGGGLSQCEAILRNNIITGNVAIERGGGLSYCNGVLLNDTIVANSADQSGGLHGCKGTIVNCIIWGNTAPNGPQLYDSSAPSYSCIQDWIGGGEGNITEGPQFLDSENGDLRLAPSSPCIDAGDNNAPDLPETDFSGMRRIIYGGRSLTVDMGAYEYYVNEISLGQSGEMTLTWSSLPGKFYSVHRSADMLTWEFAGDILSSPTRPLSTWVDRTVDMLSPEVRIRYYCIKEYE